MPSTRTTNHTIPPLRAGWADARRFPLTVAILKFWERPDNDTLRWLAAIQLHRCASAGLPSILAEYASERRLGEG